MEVSVIILQNYLIAGLGKNYQLSRFSLLQTQFQKKAPRHHLKSHITTLTTSIHPWQGLL